MPRSLQVLCLFLWAGHLQPVTAAALISCTLADKLRSNLSACNVLYLLLLHVALSQRRLLPQRHALLEHDAALGHSQRTRSARCARLGAHVAMKLAVLLGRGVCMEALTASACRMVRSPPQSA